MKEIESLLAEIHHNLGCVSTEINDPTGALTHFEEFNRLAAEDMGSDSQSSHKRLAISWNELGNGYLLNEMHEKGKEAFRKSIIIMKETDGFRSIDVSLPYVNLGLANWLTGQHEDALNILLEGIGHREAAYGIDDKQSFMYAVTFNDHARQLLTG